MADEGNEVVLRKPTVAEVMKLLATLPQDAPFRIQDADTYWEISIVHVEIDEAGTVWFSGKYHEMN